MRVTVIPAAALSVDDERRWRDIQHSNPALDSPCFCPEFIRAVSAVDRSVEIALLEGDRDRVGYFPFQRHRFGYGRPAGAGMSDFHGPVVRPDFRWSARELIE